jgi:hypothetical protein
MDGIETTEEREEIDRVFRWVSLVLRLVSKTRDDEMVIRETMQDYT